jgi:dTMP kinase
VSKAARTPPAAGRLWVFEGIDGSGKSTQARLLYEALRRRKVPAVLSHEPTDSPYGRKLRQMALNGREAISREEELALFVEDRKIHVRELIAPALAAGQMVILDRYYFSTMAYQGALGLNPDAIRWQNERFSPPPDRLLLIEVPVQQCLERIRTQRSETPNLFEKASYLERVAAIFATLDDDFIVRIDGRQDAATIHATVMAHLQPRLNQIRVAG